MGRRRAYCSRSRHRRVNIWNLNRVGTCDTRVLVMRRVAPTQWALTMISVKIRYEGSNLNGDHTPIFNCLEVSGHLLEGSSLLDVTIRGRVTTPTRNQRFGDLVKGRRPTAAACWQKSVFEQSDQLLVRARSQSVIFGTTNRRSSRRNTDAVQPAQ